MKHIKDEGEDRARQVTTGEVGANFSTVPFFLNIIVFSDFRPPAIFSNLPFLNIIVCDPEISTSPPETYDALIPARLSIMDIDFGIKTHIKIQNFEYLM